MTTLAEVQGWKVARGIDLHWVDLPNGDTLLTAIRNSKVWSAYGPDAESAFLKLKLMVEGSWPERMPG